MKSKTKRAMSAMRAATTHRVTTTVTTTAAAATETRFHN